MIVIHQISEMIMEDNLATNGTLFQVEQALLGSGLAILQTEVELQQKMYFQKDQDQRHILKEASNRIVHLAHFVYLLMSPCFVLF